MKIDVMGGYIRTINAFERLGFVTVGQVIDKAMDGYHCLDNAFTLRDGLLRLHGIGPVIADDFLANMELPNAEHQRRP